MDGSQKEGGNFLNLLQKEGVPRKGAGCLKKGGVPNLEESTESLLRYLSENSKGFLTLLIYKTSQTLQIDKWVHSLAVKTCAWKLKVPGSIPSASHVQR